MRSRRTVYKQLGNLGGVFHGFAADGQQLPRRGVKTFGVHMIKFENIKIRLRAIKSFKKDMRYFPLTRYIGGNILVGVNGVVLNS